jgi:hypothetical protein
MGRKLKVTATYTNQIISKTRSLSMKPFSDHCQILDEAVINSSLLGFESKINCRSSQNNQFSTDYLKAKEENHSFSLILDKEKEICRSHSPILPACGQKTKTAY